MGNRSSDDPRRGLKYAFPKEHGWKLSLTHQRVAGDKRQDKFGAAQALENQRVTRIEP